MRSDGLTLSLEEVNAIVRAPLQRVLDEVEAARALSDPRSPNAARAAADAHRQRGAALRRALATNDLAALWPAAAPSWPNWKWPSGRIQRHLQEAHLPPGTTPLPPATNGAACSSPPMPPSGRGIRFSPTRP